MLAAAFLYLALPEPLSLGPSWRLLAIIFVLLIPLVVSTRRKRYDVVAHSTFTAKSDYRIYDRLAGNFDLRNTRTSELAATLLRSATALWFTNVLVFALWYWKLDAGGPLGRDSSRGRLNSSFLFPQMYGASRRDHGWSPHFMDYLFLAFNTSTAFSPTDTAALSRWAKIGMMLQSLISLTIVALLAARAVNILSGRVAVIRERGGLRQRRAVIVACQT